MGIQRPIQNQITISVGQLHAGQIEAYRALRGYRFMALRCGRRFGKTELAKAWIIEGLLKGEVCAWLAPQHMLAAEVHMDLSRHLAAVLGSDGNGIMRLITGGRLDFWTLENASAGRSRYYQRVVIDEAAFGKDENESAGSLMETWERGIKPTLFDYGGRALICSNSAGKNPDNFFYRICTDPKFGFREYHAITFDNPLLPKRLPGEGESLWLERQSQFREELRRDNDPLVFAQEYLAEFVDWSGAAFFNREKLLVNGSPVPYPTRCDSVFAVIDTASKTGTDHDATAVTFYSYNPWPKVAPLLILDWDVVQIEGALLETWLPSVFDRLETLSQSCGACFGSIGVFIEDKNSGTILLQQAQRRGLQAQGIDSKLTAMGKDERAISVSGYVHQGKVKYTDHAFNKTAVYKQRSANHLVGQIESFRLGDKKSDREDDLLDTFCYGIAMALGNSEGF
jgi:hypothetical protein